MAYVLASFLVCTYRSIDVAEKVEAKAKIVFDVYHFFLDWWLVRDTLVVSFGFLPQTFGSWQGPTNDTFLFCECR